MKKISTAAALLAAGAMLFGSLVVACSPHGTGMLDEVTNPGKGPESEPEDNGKPVDGTWDFTGTDTYSIGTNDSIITDKALANPTAKGATLSVKGNLKWGNGSDDPKDFCFWFKKASAYAEGKVASKASGYLTLTTENKANLTLVYQGGGTAEDKRWIAVCDSTDKLFSNEALVQNLASTDGYKTLTLKNLKKGTYKIYASGSRIRSLQITNQAFESKTADVTNDVATLGLVATDVRNSDETIATGEVKDGKIVITSKKEGTAKVYAGTSETEYATINVTVSSTGAITTNIIKYVAFTAATNADTANNIATLGLVGTSVASSAQEYVTADLTTTTDKITIKSVKAPGDSAKNVTITVTDAAGKAASIPVTENRDGSLTLGNITKYAVPKPVSGTDFELSADKKLTAKKDNMEYKVSTATEYTALTANTPTAALENGSYSIRFKAVDNAYAASEDTTFTVSNGGSVNETWSFATNPASFDTSSASVAGTATVVTSDDGSSDNVVFTILATAKAKYDGTINCSRDSSASAEEGTGGYAIFSINPTVACTATVTYKSAGSSEYATRTIYAGSVKSPILTNTEKQNLVFDCPANTETSLSCSGMKISKVKVTSN